MNGAKKPEWLVPVAASAAFHVVLVFLAAFIVVGSTRQADHLTRKFRVKGVNNLPIIPGKPGGGDRLASGSKRLRFASREKAGTARAPADVSLEKLIRPDETPVISNRALDVSPKKVELADPSLVSARDFQTILSKTDERQLKEKVQSTQRSTKTSLDKILTQDAKPQGERLLQSLGKPLSAIALPVSAGVDLDPEEGMPGFTPIGRGGGGGGGEGPGSPGGTPDGIVGEAREDVTPYEALDDFLDIAVVTYEDPSDKEKYFMIKIFAKKGAPLTVMPKEMIFTIDCSLSISPDRLDEFKKGIRLCLETLNPKDVFNIVAFRDEAIYFSRESIPATADAIERAEAFVGGLTSNERTDVYGAISRIVKTPPARRPSNVLLISDGRPTQGVVNDRELLSAISRANAKVRPIFAFSGGRRVNRYLLDFAAYQNRAWAEYIKKTADVDTGLAAFFAKIKDPIFLNLRYRLGEVDEAEVYPRSLPDFYKDAEFTLFGRYGGEDEFTMQLLGDVEGKTKELVFARSLRRAPKGGPDVRKGWAFNKIYHLISRLNTEPENASLIEEIRSLGKRYGVITPYSEELEKLD